MPPGGRRGSGSAFERARQQAAHEVAAQQVVIGAAAWVILDPECAHCLGDERCVVYLRARPETLLARIGAGEGRRSDATDAAWLEAHASERDAAYRQLATFSVDVDERSPEEVAAMVVRLTSVGWHGPPDQKQTIDQG